MNEPGYLKCPCHCCRGAIEFPVEGVGRTISCPHCGQETTLFAASVGTETEGAPEPAPSIAEPALGLTDETLSPEGETVAADSAAPPPSAGFRWLGIVVVILLASGGAVAL